MPISNEQFPSNWELSSARATGVARYFVEDDGLVAAPHLGARVRRIPARAFRTTPMRIAPQNRRVDVVILDTDAATNAQAAAEAQALAGGH